MLQFKNFSFGYKYPLINKTINVDIPPSSLTVLFGNNGSGKTCLIKTLARLNKPLSGDVFYNQRPIQELDASYFSRHFAFLMTVRPFLMNHTIMDIIALGRIPYLRWDAQLNEEDIKVIEYYAHYFNLKDILSKPANEVSDGQLQKALIVRTLVQQTNVVILDEPLSFLDYGTKKLVIKKLKQIAREENKIVILSAHDIHLCLEYVDAVFLIHQKDWAYNDKDKITSSEVFENFLNTEE